MQITGDGITEFQCKTLTGYKVRQTLALKWLQLASGNWTATDRGASEDIYEADISIRGLESVINAFLDQIQLNRLGSTTPNVISLSGFSASEHIFGENVDHSYTYTATITDMGKRQQVSWKTYTLPMSLRLTGTVYFTGTSSFPTLTWCDPGGEQDEDFTVKKAGSHSGVMAYSDHRSDSGIFDGKFTMLNADYIKLLNYIRTQRSGDFALANTFGVAYPFGKRSINSYPFTCKLIEWEDLGLFGLKYNRVRLKFAEAV